MVSKNIIIRIGEINNIEKILAAIYENEHISMKNSKLSFEQKLLSSFVLYFEREMRNFFIIKYGLQNIYLNTTICGKISS